MDRHGCLIACTNENFKIQPKCSSTDIFNYIMGHTSIQNDYIVFFFFSETGKFPGHMAYQYEKNVCYVIKCTSCSNV